MTISAETRRAVREMYQYRCGYCGVSETAVGGELEIDHFHPLSEGGTDALDNLVYACTHCNRFKSSYWPAFDQPDSLKLLHPRKDDIQSYIR